METLLTATKSQLLQWAAAWPYALFLDSCGSAADRYGPYECLVGVAQSPENERTDWEQLKALSNTWAMGLLPYDLKHRFEPSLGGEAASGIVFPETTWFVPEAVAVIRRGSTEVEWLVCPGSATLAAFAALPAQAAHHDTPEKSEVATLAAFAALPAQAAHHDTPEKSEVATLATFAALPAQAAHHDTPEKSEVPTLAAFAAQAVQPEREAIPLTSTFSRDQYLAAVDALRGHIREGDCYEINLAQAFSASGVSLDPVAVFQALTAISPVPFAAFFRWKTQYVLCASPERFLQKQGGQLVSQPIKGTAKRGKTPAEDEALRAALRQSEKEQAENVMIVDLTRNDLHRSCTTGSVEVPDLFEIQSFPTVHQMVSTITGQVRPELSWQQVVAHTFPPGSMTGAPKVKAMELIRRYEPLARGAYAGSLGYCTPENDFDLNVVIRSIVLHAASGQLSYHVGGAITFDSDPEAEYAETLLKALAIEHVLQNPSF